jgi:hypothetical protein
VFRTKVLVQQIQYLQQQDAVNDAGNQLWLGEGAGGSSSPCPADHRGASKRLAESRGFK